jgi:TrmH family RNA methyltransferase
MTITSPHNEKLKEVRKLRQRRHHRERAQRFVAEGEDLLSAADAAGWEPVERLAAAGSGLPGQQVLPELLAAASELGSGVRTLAVYEERWAKAPLGPVCVYLHGVRDPGNVGAVLRSAEAFAAACVALGPGSADPYGPKAVRASMGAIFTIPVVHAGPGELPGTTVALDAGAEIPLAELGLGEEVSLLIGAEREGLPAEVVARADHAARIPIASHSLNAAMAATVALYELRRMAR